MNLSQLHTFIIVSKCLSFTEAAQILSISQPAVSRQIAVMEDELQTTLFDRDRNTISLTSAGEFFLSELEPIWERLQTVIKKTSEFGSGVVGWLSIGLLEDQLLDENVTRALKSLQKNGVRLYIHRFSFRSLEESLANGEIDIAISIEQSSEVFRNYKRFLYAEEGMYLAVSRGIAPPDDVFDLDKILESNLLLLPNLDSFPEYQRSLLNSLIDKGIGFGQPYDFPSIAPMVSAGLAITIVNDSHCLSMDDKIVLHPMSHLPKVGKGIFWSASNHNPVIKYFVDAVKSESASG